MDATFVWTVVGSSAGVVGVGVAVIALVVQAQSGRRTDAEVTAELAYGQLAQDGVLCVEFASGKTDVIVTPKPGEARATADRKVRRKVWSEPELQPVNAIFIRNAGRATVTVTRCHYLSRLGDAEFRFEPQPAASPRGDHLPKRLEPGEDALLLHDLVTMRVFLNHVLRDHAVDVAVFRIVLTLGHGVEVVASPSLRLQADMSDQEIAAAGTRLARQEIDLHTPLTGFARSVRWRWRRRTQGV